MITVIEAIQSLYPGAECVVTDNDATRVEWHSDGVAPTPDEIHAEVARLEAAAATAAADKAAARAALLERLGITEDEAALLREAGI